MMFNQYPYINVNDLNLDYILSQIKTMMNEVTNFVSINAIKYANPIQWDITRQYEKNTVVIDPVTGTAYISVAPVPAGVALTRPEYWTVVFDLGSFVTRAAQNFTSRYESETTLTATFPSATGEWLVWGDVLYKALTNITAGDTYVVNGNIEHFTIEDLYNAYLNTIASILAMIGDLQDLTTSDTTDIVHAINSVLNDLNLTIGDLADLTTSDTTDVVHAINAALSDANDHTDTIVGNLDDLNTSDKDSIVGAINENVNNIAALDANLGSIKNAVRDKIVFIGDSYARDVTRDGNLVYGWITRLIDDFEFSNAVRLVSEEAGKTATGFHSYNDIGVSFLTMLQDYVGTLTPEEIAEIKTICVCGGGNDDVSSAAQLNPDISDFMDYVKATLPNARVFIGFIYGDLRTTTNYTYVNIARFCYHSAGQYGAFYLNGVDNAFHNYAQGYASDGHHPNNAGSIAITRAIRNALLTGYAGQYLNKRNVTGTPDAKFADTSSATFFIQSQANDFIECQLQAFGRNLTGDMSFAEGATIDIATVPASLIRPDTILGDTVVRFYSNTDRVIEYIPALVKISDQGILQIVIRGKFDNALRINLYTTDFMLNAAYC